MENQLLPISPCEPQETSASTDKLIRQWLFRFAVEHKEDIAPRLPLWLEAFGGMDAAILEKLFTQALKTCRFFPKVADILAPIQKAEETAAPQAAEKEWERVLELRRRYWNPDMPGGFSRGMPRLSERVEQAARAAGVFRDFESVDSLHVWAKKRFIASFVAYGELEQDGFLLPDGEIKNLLAQCTQTKALPAPSGDWGDLRKRGEAYRAQMANSLSQAPAAPGRKYRNNSMLSLGEQKRILVERGFLPRTPGEATAVNPPELQPVEVSA